MGGLPGVKAVSRLCTGLVLGVWDGRMDNKLLTDECFRLQSSLAREEGQLTLA